MKKLLSLGTTVLITANAGATLLFYDGFDYTSGDLLAPLNDTTSTPNPGQLNVIYGYNWRYAGGGAAANKAPGIATSGLNFTDVAAYSSLPIATAGNSVLFDATQVGSARIQVTPAAISSGTTYWSGLLQVGAVSNLNAVNGMLLGGFHNVTGAGTLPTTVGAVLRIRQNGSDPTRYDIGTGMNTGTAAGIIQWSPTSYAAGETVFVVAAYEYVVGPSNDKARMWFNPAPGTFEDASPPGGYIESNPLTGTEFGNILSFNLRNVNTVGTPTGVRFDELRVGTTWADVMPVIPEPAAAGLLGFGLLAILGWHRARRH